MSFRDFRIYPHARTLFRRGRPVEIGTRAFDLLCVLLRSRGRVVSKAEINRHVWPSLVVEESNLRFQIAALRDLLGVDGTLVKTVRGRGYLFADEADNIPLVAPVTYAGSESAGPGAFVKPTVMIVDDDDETRDALCGLVRSAGLAASGYATIENFMERVPADNPACLVLDVWLGGRSGLDVQTALRKSHPSLPVIFISGHADVHTSVSAMKGGALEFLEKPVRHQDLLAAIFKAVSPHRALDHADLWRSPEGDVL